ncbi:MAG: hypothetical protein Q4D42_05670 [Eubacteriales bacterium]|nr:hypothetical protein [Eubacteriales bacterium]
MQWDPMVKQWQCKWLQHMCLQLLYHETGGLYGTNSDVIVDKKGEMFYPRLGLKTAAIPVIIGIGKLHQETADVTVDFHIKKRRTMVKERGRC